MSTRPRALVTGGAGFIGHHLVAALRARGHDVTVLDDLSMGKRSNVPEDVRFVEGDVRDPAAVDEALDGVSIVFHEAAIVSIRASIEGFANDADVNLTGTLNLLQRMAGKGITRALLASSMAVYSDSPTPTPMPESSPTEPISPYGIAKLAAEKYWLMMGKTLGLEPTVLRYFNTYGPGQTPTPYVGVITIFINRLLAGEGITVFGDGEQRRDFVHVSDIVGANLAVLEAPTEAVAGRIFNVGTGHATSVNDIARGVLDVLAPGTDPIMGPEQQGEMRNAIADATALAEATGFRAKRRAVDFADVVDFWRRSGSQG